MTNQIDGPYIPPAPERAPGGGWDMPKAQWQHDAWLPKSEPDPAAMIEETLDTIQQLEARYVPVVDNSGGEPRTALGPDPLDVTAARLLGWYMRRVYGRTA